MTACMRALLLAAAMLTASFASAEDAPAPISRLQSAQETAERIAAAGELARPPHRGQEAYRALGEAMNRDLSDRVRLAAAVAVITYPGGATLELVGAFLKTEPGSAVRRELLVALSTEPAHFENPDATRLLVAALADDPSPEVRRGAAEALGARGDALALGAVGRASEKDENKDVRAAARGATLILAKPPKPRPKPKPPAAPDPNGVFGVDPCPRPWGWCNCYGAIRLKPKCLTRPECRSRQNEMRNHGLSCNWDGHSED